MRALRYVAAITTVLLSGWTLLAYHGLRTAEQDRARGWEIYQLPLHPRLFMTAFLILSAILPFLSAWLIRPHQISETEDRHLTGVLWQSYLFRLGFSTACGLLTAVAIGSLAMAYLDSR